MAVEYALAGKLSLFVPPGDYTACSTLAYWAPHYMQQTDIAGTQLVTNNKSFCVLSCCFPPIVHVHVVHNTTWRSTHLLTSLLPLAFCRLRAVCLDPHGHAKRPSRCLRRGLEVVCTYSMRKPYPVRAASGQNGARHQASSPALPSVVGVRHANQARGAAMIANIGKEPLKW